MPSPWANQQQADIIKNIRYGMLVRYKRMRMWSHGVSGTHEQLTLLVMPLAVGDIESVGESIITGCDDKKQYDMVYETNVQTDDTL